MIRAYQWMLHAEAVEAFQTLTKRRRARLIRAFERLAAHPFATPKIVSRDAEDADVFTVFDDSIAIHYQVDHAARRVYVSRLNED